MANNTLISFSTWYAQYDDTASQVNTLEDSVVAKMYKTGVRTAEEWDNYYLITEINAMVKQTEVIYGIYTAAYFCRCADGTYSSRFYDISDDGDFTEYIVGWLSSHDIAYECELTEEGMTEIKITL